MATAVSTPADLRVVVDAVMEGFALVGDDGWDQRAYGLDWDCRDTAAHLLDDFGFYAMNLAGRAPPQDAYIDLIAAMGIVEAAAHAWDVLTAHGMTFRVEDGVCERVLNRLFPGAVRSGDAWQDFLTATGRTEATRDQPWTWDSSVRDRYGT